jgi:hypothetical protein
MSFGEFVYRSVLLAFLEGAGVHVLPEIHSSLGRVDLVVERAGHAWVIEIKVAKKAEDVERQADEAMLQIHEKGYARQYDNPVLLGLAIDDRKRCIGGYRLNNEPFRAVEPPPYTVDCARPGLGNLWRMLRRLIGE